MSTNTLFRSVVIAIFIGCASQGYAQTGCQIIPPMATLVLESIYTDAKGSIEDHAAEDRNAAQNKDLRTFMALVENALDKSTARPGNPETDCAFKQFDSWARAGALTFEPPSYNREGKISRGLINPGYELSHHSTAAVIVGVSRFRDRSIERFPTRWLTSVSTYVGSFDTAGSGRSTPT